MAVTTAPAAPSDRINALDTLRGVAVLGILVINIMAMGMPLETANHPTVYGGHEGADFWSWFIADTFVAGSMRAVFSALFGAGFILLIERLEQRGVGLRAADIHYRRLAFLAAFGLVDMYVFYWDGDILFVYAIVGAFLFPFRKLTPGWLFAAAGALVALGMLLQPSWPNSLADSRVAYEQLSEIEASAPVEGEGAAVADEERAALESRAELWVTGTQISRPPQEAIDADINLRRSGYVQQFRANFMHTTEIQHNDLFVMLIPNPDALIAMLLGIALMKLGVLNGKAPLRVYVGMLVLGYGIGIPVSLWESLSYANSGFDILAHARAGVTYDISRLGMAAGHMSLVFLLCKWRGAGAIGRIVGGTLSSVGRMALSNYLLHSICALFLFTGAGLALFGAFSRSEILLVMVGIWALNIAFSVLWLRHYRFGPAEWLWRSLTYWKLQPIRRSQTISSTEPATA